MAYIDKGYKRLVRIHSKPDALAGNMIEVVDAKTSELIKNVTGMVIRLKVKYVNECEITYVEMDKNDHVVLDEHYQHIENTITLPDITIAGITAYEVDTWEQEFDSTFCLYEPTEDGYENAEYKVKEFIRGILGRR